MSDEFLDDRALDRLGAEIEASYVKPFMRRIGNEVRVLNNIELLAWTVWRYYEDRRNLIDRWRCINER